MNNWSTLATDKSIKKTINALKANGINAIAVNNKKQAKEKVLELLPKGAEVMDMSSVTIDSLEIAKKINESGNYNSVKQKLMKMDRKTQGLEMQKIGSAPEYAVGSVHAVTEDGKVIISSNTGSQLPAYSYGASHVIWVVGTQKIVKDLEQGFRRIYKYVLPLESERMQKLYGFHSFVSKLLIINKEIKPNRITLIFVKEKLGF